MIYAPFWTWHITEPKGYASALRCPCLFYNWNLISGAQRAPYRTMTRVRDYQVLSTECLSIFFETFKSNTSFQCKPNTQDRDSLTDINSLATQSKFMHSVASLRTWKVIRWFRRSCVMVRKHVWCNTSPANLRRRASVKIANTVLYVTGVERI